MNLTSVKIQQKWLVLIAIGMSTFMSALDTSVVNTVLPVITNSFDSHIATVEWAVCYSVLVDWVIFGVINLYSYLVSQSSS